MIFRFAIAVCALVLFASPAFAQDEAGVIDKTLVPAEASNAREFAPRGWKIEQQVTGDLNGDSRPDFALKLVEDKPEKNSEGDVTERGRALVLVLGNRRRQTKARGRGGRFAPMHPLWRSFLRRGRSAGRGQYRKRSCGGRAGTRIARRN